MLQIKEAEIKRKMVALRIANAIVGVWIDDNSGITSIILRNENGRVTKIVNKCVCLNQRSSIFTIGKKRRKDLKHLDNIAKVTTKSNINPTHELDSTDRPTFQYNVRRGLFMHNNNIWDVRINKFKSNEGDDNWHTP